MSEYPEIQAKDVAVVRKIVQSTTHLSCKLPYESVCSLAGLSLPETQELCLWTGFDVPHTNGCDPWFV